MAGSAAVSGRGHEPGKGQMQTIPSDHGGDDDDDDDVDYYLHRAAAVLFSFLNRKAPMRR